MTGPYTDHAPRAAALQQRWARFVVVAVLAGTLAHIVYLWFVCDDAYITFRYARNLANGLGPVYNPGERVEGYTNFLWMLLSSVVQKLGGEPEVWMPVASMVCALVTVFAVMSIAPRREESPGVAGVLAGILLAGSASFAAWATSGLETALFGMLVTLGFLGVARGGGAGAGLALGLASLTRPEGMLFGACACTYAWVQAARSGASQSGARTATLIWAGIVAAHFAFRLGFYGHWLPHTFAVKTPGAASITIGTAYLLGAVRWLHLYFLAIPILAIGFLRRSTVTPARGAWWPWSLLAVMVLPYLAYVATTRGDFMPLYRFVAPVLPLMAIAAGAALATLVTGAGRLRRFATIVGVVWVAGYAILNLSESREEQAPWTRGDLESVGLTRENAMYWSLFANELRDVALPTDTLATTAAGIIPYRTDLYTTDLLGLTAPELSAYRPRATSRAGHALYLGGERLLSLHPHFLLGHPQARPGREPVGLTLDVESPLRERLLSAYRLERFEVTAKPRRLVAVAVRNDIVARVQAAGKPRAHRP